MTAVDEAGAARAPPGGGTARALLGDSGSPCAGAEGEAATRPPAGEEPTESMSRTGAERLRTVSRGKYLRANAPGLRVLIGTDYAERKANALPLR